MIQTVKRFLRWCLVGLLLHSTLHAQVEKRASELQNAAMQAWSQSDYAKAGEALRILVRLQPENGEAWFRLGFALQQQEQSQAALESYLKAIEHSPRRAPTAAFNLACIAAREDQGETAIRWLNRAAELGFANWNHAQSDPELASLHEDSRFTAVIERMKAIEMRDVRLVAIYVHEGVELLDFAGPGEVFTVARGAHGERFRVVTVAETKQPITSQRFLKLEPQYSFEDCPQPDILVLPGGATGLALQQEGLVPWVKRVTPKAQVVMSVCTGAFILAEAGLLDGVEATTHFGSLEALRNSAPKARIRGDRRIVDDGKIVTTAGVSAGIDGALHIVSRLLGEQVATDCARYMEYRWIRDHFRGKQAEPSSQTEERDVRIPSTEEGQTYAGSLVLPNGSGPHPAVLLVSPAGDHGRNELRSDGQHYIDLAERLAAHGIASLRVDNRGIGQSKSAAWPEWSWSITIAELATELAAQFDWLRRRPEIDFHRVGVLAHGDGTIPAAYFAADRVPGARRPAFTILLSASGRRGVLDLTDRMAANLPSATDRALREAALARLTTALDGLVASGPTETVIEDLAACLPSLGIPDAQAAAMAQGFVRNFGDTWHREYLGYEPQELIGRIQGPLLLLWADNDDRLHARESEQILSEVLQNSLAFNSQWKRLQSGGHFMEPEDERKVLRTEVVEEVLLFITDATGFDLNPVESAPHGATEILIEDVAILELEAGAVREHQWVLIRDGLITTIGDTRPKDLNPEARIVDGRARYLMPGLWDSHVHTCMWGKSALARFVQHGVTTIRDMGGEIDELTAWRAQIESGEIIGPNLLIAGPFLDGDKPNDIYRRFLLDVDQVEPAVDQLIHAGVDFLKVHSRLAPAVFGKLAAVARERNIHLVGHVPVGMLPTEASAVGMTSIEHADTFLSAMVRARDGGMASWPEARDWWHSKSGREALQEIRASGTVVVPSLVIVDTIANRFEGPAAMMATWTREIARAIHAAGIPLVAGTDTARRLIGVAPGSALHRELELLVECGLSPAEALRSATVIPARRFGRLSKNRLIAVGQAADLILLGANPLDEISNSRAIELVLSRGRIVSHD